MLVLGIESSCDETAAAVVEDGKTVHSSVVSSQVDLHRRFRGVVPEVASRAHLRNILPVLEDALKQGGVEPAEVDAVAVASFPGLIGSLLVGISAARAFALCRGVPLVEVNHLHAHVYSAALEHDVPYPLVALVVSGGHTELFFAASPTSLERLGGTVDDAAGEAFDKVAVILGLPYPGGPAVESLAAGGDPGAVRFPVSFKGDGTLRFSFSGVKTAVLYYCKEDLGKGEMKRSVVPKDVAASFQRVVVDVLVEKTILAAERTGAVAVVAGGGVVCNGELRKRLRHACDEKGIPLYLPSPRYCTDNAAMVAGLGFHLLKDGIGVTRWAWTAKEVCRWD